MNVINHYKNLAKHDKKLVHHTKLISRKRFFDDELASKIIRSFDLSSAKGSDLFNKSVLKAKIHYQRELINILKNGAKDKNKEISRLQVDLQHEQNLQLSFKKDIKNLRGKVKTSQHGFIWQLLH